MEWDFSKWKAEVKKQGKLGFLDSYIEKYAIKMVKKHVAGTNRELFKIKSSMHATGGVGGTGLFLQLLDTENDPTTRPNGTALQTNDWYVNTEAAEMRFYKKGTTPATSTWYKIPLTAIFSSALQAWKRDVTDGAYVSSEEFISLAEIVNNLSTSDLSSFAEKWLSGDNLIRIVKNINESMSLNLIDSTDNVTVVASNRLEYKDAGNGLRTGWYEMTLSDGSIFYNTLAHVYERLHQIGAHFTGYPKNKTTSVAYSLSSSNYNGQAIALKFISKAAGSWYKWEHIQVVENERFKNYIEFSGHNTSLQILEAIIPGMTENNIELHDLDSGKFKIAVDDLFPSGEDKTIIEFKTSSRVSIGEQIATLELLAPAQFSVNRYVQTMEQLHNTDQQLNDEIQKVKKDSDSVANNYNSLKSQLDTLKTDIYNFTVHKYPGAVSFGNAIYTYQPGDIAGTAQAGATIQVDMSGDIAGLFGNSHIGLAEQGKVLDQSQATEFVCVKLNADITERTNLANALTMAYVDVYKDKFYIQLTRTADFDGKLIWVYSGLTEKKAAPKDFKFVDKDYTVAQMNGLANLDIVNTAYAKVVNKLSIAGGVVEVGTTLIFNGDTGNADMTNNSEYDWKLNLSSNQIDCYKNGSKIGSADFSDFSWRVREAHGQVFTGSSGGSIEPAKNYYTSYDNSAGTITVSEAPANEDYEIEFELKARNKNEPIRQFRSIVHMKPGLKSVVSEPVKFKVSASSDGFGTGDGPDGPVYYAVYNVTLTFNQGASANTIGSITVNDVEFFDPYSSDIAKVDNNGTTVPLRAATGGATVAQWLKETLVIKNISKAGELRNASVGFLLENKKIGMNTDTVADNEIVMVAGTTVVKIDATGIYLNGAKVQMATIT